MRSFLIWCFVFIATIANAQTMGGSSGPVIWSGSTGQVLPSTGLSLPNQRSIRLFEATGSGTNYTELKAASSMSSNPSFIFPSFQGATGAPLLSAGSGATSWANLDISDNVNAITGVLPMANGGTNKNMTAAAGSVVYSDTDSLELLAAGTSTQVLHGGAGAPVWGSVNLATDTSGTLDMSDGGTSKNLTPAAGGVVYTDVDSMEVLAAGTSGQYLKSNGTSAPSWSAIDISTASITGVLPLANGGTNKNMTAVAGGVVWMDADSQEVTAAGTNGMPLLSTGSTAPSFGWPSVNSTSSDYTVTNTDGYSEIVLTGTTGRTFTLPDASSNSRRRITFTNLGTSAAILTIARAGSDTIGPLSETSITLAIESDSITLVSNGSNNWRFLDGYYQSRLHQTTFTFDGTGGGTSATATLYVIRRGGMVSLNIPTVTATTGTSSTRFDSNTDLPSWASPISVSKSNAYNAGGNNGTADNSPSVIFVNTAGNIVLFRTNASAAWTNSASAGFGSAVTVSYYVGTGS